MIKITSRHSGNPIQKQNEQTDKQTQISDKQIRLTRQTRQTPTGFSVRKAASIFCH